MSRGVYSLYPDPASAQRAVNRLRSAGIPSGDIAVISDAPYEEYDFSKRDKATWMYWIAGGGGVVGLSFGIWLTSMSQRAWPLPTGGMPIVATWPNLVVIFELTMLFGILATVITLLVTAEVPRPRPVLYDPEVADGHILVGVEREDLVEQVRRVLETDALARVKTIDH